MKIKVKCPKCKNEMLYESRSNDFLDNKKRCVYCGHTFIIRGNIR